MNRVATAALLISLVVAPNARAASRIIVVDDSDRATRDATARLRAELVASGFTVDTNDGGDAQSVATIRLTRDAATRSTEVSVSDRLTGKTLVRRVSADPERSPRLVALRGVELLRASLLELASPPKDDAPPATPALASPPPPEVVKLVGPTPTLESPPPHPAPARWSDRVSLDAGAAVLASTEGLGAAFAPTIGAWLPLPGHFALRPRVAGPAYRSGVANAIGSASTHQELASVDLAWAPFDSTVVPFIALGGGAYHLHVDGTATATGYHDASDDIWSAVVSAGLGTFVRLASSVALAVDARAIELTPHPVVAIGNARVAAAGAPSIFVSASLVAAF